MNYRHIYHAGGFSDVVKHVILSLLIERLKRKPAPFMVLDTHAGIGRYDLTAPQALKTAEFRGGIARLTGDGHDVRFGMQPALRPYLDVVRALNPDGALRWYPGSPRLARALMRAEDRLALVERHPEDAAALQREFRHDRHVGIHHADGYQALKALLPPHERRGLVLIDPPFEHVEEFARLATGLKTGYERWPTGIFALWYPIKERPAVWRFHDALERLGIRRILAAELTVHPDDDHRRLNGTGMILVNPPWQIDMLLRDLLPVLHTAFGSGSGGSGSGGSRIDWIVPE